MADKQNTPLTSDVVALATIAAIFIGPLPKQANGDMAYQNADAVLLAARDYLNGQRDPEKNIDSLRRSWAESGRGWDNSRYGR
jgi:hypothetical protein